MAAITDLDDLIQILATTGTTETLMWSKNFSFSGNAASTGYLVQPNVGFSMWLFGGAPSRGETPTTASTLCDNTTAGGLKQSTTTPGKEKFLIQHGLYSTQSTGTGSWLLYDRLVHAGGFDANITTLQTVNTPPLNRYSGSSSVGNVIMVEVYSLIGANARTLDIKYTNQDGVSGRTSLTRIGATGTLRQGGQTNICTLQSGDTGVRSIETIQLLVGGTNLSGNFGISIIHPISTCQILPSMTGSIKDFATGLPGIPKIEPNACLAYLFYPNTNSSLSDFEDWFGFLTFIEK